MNLYFYMLEFLNFLEGIVIFIIRRGEQVFNVVYNGGISSRGRNKDEIF